MPARKVFRTRFFERLVRSRLHFSPVSWTATARRTVHYGSVSEILIDRLQVLLHHLGYHAHRYTTRPTSKRARINGRKVVGRYPFSSLEIRGDEALRLSGELDLAVRQKSQRAAAMRKTARPMQLRSDLVPFGAQVVFPA